MGLCHPFSLIWLESSVNSLSNLFNRKSKENLPGNVWAGPHAEGEGEPGTCSSLSARSALSVNTSLANLYKFQT